MSSGNTQSSAPPDDLVDLSRFALEAMGEGVAVFDADLRLTICNQSYIDMFPRIKSVIVEGVHWDDILRAAVENGEIVDPFNDVDALINRAYGHRSNTGNETVAEHFDGRTYRLQFKPTPSGGCVAIRREIKEQPPEKIMLRDRETLVATVLDTSPVAIVMARLDDGRILYRSQEARMLFGDTVNAREHYTSKEARDGYVRALKKKGTVTGYRLTSVRADGTTFESESAGRIVEYIGQTCVVTAVTDLTEQMEREALTRHVVESCPTPIQMTNAETGETLFSSPKATELFGNPVSSKSMYVSLDDRNRQVNELREKGVMHDFRAEFYDR
ncbi:MAG: PAS-domain containing protein, partial [Roseibium sp.]